MKTLILCIQSGSEVVLNQSTGLSVSDILTAGISIATLLLNILFYIIIAPRISFRFQKKADFLKYASEFLNYLSEINSFSEFDGVPTKVRSYCMTIELLFKSGVAPEPLHSQMESVFQSIKRRKTLKSNQDIDNWASEFKNLTHNLRKSLAKYTGVF